MAVLTESPRTATVLTLEETTVYVVEGDVLRRELDAMKPWMAMLLKRLAQRFTDMYRSRRVLSTFMPTLPSARVANQLLMHLHVWGEKTSEGKLRAKWSRIASEIEAQQGAPPMSIGAVAARYVGHVRIDIDGDVVEITDPDGLKRKLEADLEKS
jgi:CRP-like cAMP-binding protein